MLHYARLLANRVIQIVMDLQKDKLLNLHLGKVLKKINISFNIVACLVFINRMELKILKTFTIA